MKETLKMPQPNVWQAELYPYIKNKKIFYCPSTVLSVPAGTDDTIGGVAQRTIVSYGWNYIYMGHYDKSKTCPYVKIIQIKNPSVLNYSAIYSFLNRNSHMIIR